MMKKGGAMTRATVARLWNYGGQSQSCRTGRQYSERNRGAKWCEWETLEVEYLLLKDSLQRWIKYWGQYQTFILLDHICISWFFSAATTSAAPRPVPPRKQCLDKQISFKHSHHLRASIQTCTHPPSTVQSCSALCWWSGDDVRTLILLWQWSHRGSPFSSTGQ